MADYRDCAKNLKFVITGTGHCGSGYISKVLSGLEIFTGHESIFRPTPCEANHLVGDSSMLAAPYLDHLPEGCKVIHQIRDPRLFIRSMFSNRTLFEPFHAYGNFMREHCPEAVQGLGDAKTPTLEWGAIYWLRWNQMIERSRTHVFRLEDIDINLILEWIEIHHTPKEVEEVIARMTTADRHEHVNCNTPQIEKGGLEKLAIYPELKAYATAYRYRV